MVYKQLTTYDPVMQRTVNCYSITGQEDKIYSYIDYQYSTSDVLTNFVTNGENFNVFENGTLQGWKSNTDADEKQEISLVTNPELLSGTPVAELAQLDQMEGFIKAKILPFDSNTYKNTIFNSGFENHSYLIKNIAAGDEFIFRWRAGISELSPKDLTEDLSLRCIVAEYTKPMVGSEYVYQIDPDNIIIHFEGTPIMLNNVIDSGTFIEENSKYVVNKVVQTPSTKYIYKDKTEGADNREYIWSVKEGTYVLKTNNNYLNYYYLKGTASYAVPNTVFQDPTRKLGIFIYTTDTNTKHLHFLQDVQITRYIPNKDSEEPIVLGNIPTAQSIQTSYYYLQPDINSTAEEIDTYTSLKALADATYIDEKYIVPEYNEGSEKILSINESQSNCFNILQTIAETFECWIDLEVEREENGAIKLEDGIPQKFVNLKEYVGKDNWAGFKYGINLDTIERNINSDEITTKLIVSQAQSDYTDSGVVTIANAKSNRSGENYILNFDYYYQQGLLNKEETQADITAFETKVKKLNNEIAEYQKKFNDVSNSLTKISSERNTYTTLIETAQDNVAEGLADFEKLSGKSYEEYQVSGVALGDDYRLTQDTEIKKDKDYYYKETPTLEHRMELYKVINTIDTGVDFQIPSTIGWENNFKVGVQLSYVRDSSEGIINEQYLINEESDWSGEGDFGHTFTDSQGLQWYIYSFNGTDITMRCESKVNVKITSFAHSRYPNVVPRYLSDGSVIIECPCGSVKGIVTFTYEIKQEEVIFEFDKTQDATIIKKYFEITYNAEEEILHFVLRNRDITESTYTASLVLPYIKATVLYIDYNTDSPEANYQKIKNLSNQNPKELEWYELVHAYTEDENFYKIVGELYANSAAINNYVGLLTNIEEEYRRIRKELKGDETFYFNVSTTYDDNNERIVRFSASDYLAPITFTLDGSVYEIDINTSYIEERSEATQFILTITDDQYKLDSSEDTGSEIVLPINDDEVNKYIIVPKHVENKGYEQVIEELIAKKEAYVNAFLNKYNRYIQEGTWNSTDYIDSELYYLDALQVSNTSAQPQVSYTINVVEISELEDYELYKFDVGDKTYVEDTEFFGWANKNVGTDNEPTYILTPAREEVIVSEVEWNLDDPSQNTITIQNYKTRFEDLFQRISATVQTVQYNEATYAKITSLLDANGTINQDVLLESLNNISGQRYNLTSDGSVLIDGDNILVRNLQNSANLVKISSEGIKISSDGGTSWATAISGRGINIGTVYTGMLNTDQVIIGNEKSPSFRWDKSGISAYKSTSTTSVIDDKEIPIYDLKTFVRFDEYGLYGIKNNAGFIASSLEDVKDRAHFAVTWDGFFIKNSYPGGGRVEITSDNDFRVMNIPEGQVTEQEKIKIGALEWGKDNQGNPILSPNDSEATTNPTLYGIRINNNAGETVMKTGDDGNLEITGTIIANAGKIGGMEVDNQRLKMKYIVFEPNRGIYSTYPNEIGKPPVDPNVSANPFIISDVDGSATFNNVIVRGSIKTSVFEYEEIQAVGGAFMFRPSTTIRTAQLDGNDLTLTVEKPLLLRNGAWYKLSNYNSDTTVDADELSDFGLTHIYQLSKVEIRDQENKITGYILKLLGAADILDTIDINDIAGGSIIDMGYEATHIDYNNGANNYGIGINSSDNYINLPPRAISLFETVVDHLQDPKVSYRYRGILGTLPDPALNNINVNQSIYTNNMVGTQGIYTNNMYIGDNKNFITYYYDKTAQEYRLIINADTIYEGYDEDDQPIPITPGQDGKDGEDAITVIIDSSAGNMFVRQDVRATLTCHVYEGSGMDPDHEIDPSRITYHWVKYDKNGTKDETWARLPGGQTITIGPEDVASKAIFKCEVEF